LLSGLASFDRLLSGGLVLGAVVTLAGEPGAGKSTLTGQIAGGVARRSGAASLLSSGEESAADVGARLRRTRSDHDLVWISEETDLVDLLAEADQVGARLLVVDSGQTLSVQDHRAGSRAALLDGVDELASWARRRGAAVILVLQVDKEGQPAGPRAVEHAAHASMRLGVLGPRERGLTLQKNRHGAAPGSASLFMTARGLCPIGGSSEGNDS
jgi:DNA repair protein RadA/Sms